MLSSTEHEMYHAHKCKMLTICGSLTFISMMNATSESLKGNSIYIFSMILVFMSS